MPTIFDKIDWKKRQRSKLSSVAIDNLTVSSKEISNTSGKLEDKNEILKEDNNMVTSTIVETNSSNKTVEAAQEMSNDNKYSAIKQPEKKQENETGKKRGRDYNSGMDLLEMDFILGVVEETSGENEHDIKMRQMCFKELLRRESRHEIASAALKVYATNGKVYGKDIQCEAMQELTFRTIQNSK